MKLEFKIARVLFVLGALLVLVGLILPIFGDSKRDPERYLTRERKEKLTAFAKEVLSENVEFSARNSGNTLVFADTSSPSMELAQKISNFMNRAEWERLEVETAPKPVLILGSYAGRTWTVYLYSEEGVPQFEQCQPEPLHGGWYYCRY
jgi:hypothetical protein